MDPQHLQLNPTHTHDFSFYDHQRREEVNRDHHVRESDLLNTIISFPSTVPSQEPFLLHRNSLQERSIIPNDNFFMHSTNSTNVSLNIGASRGELQQLNSSRDMCVSSAPSSSIAKIQDMRSLSSINARYNAENILARFASNNPRLGGGDEGRGEQLWSYADRNDIPNGSISSLQLPMNMSLGESLQSYPGAHSMVSTMLTTNGDKSGGASYAMSTHRRDGMWADGHGTELLLLPGISGMDDSHHHRHHRNIANVQDQAGKDSLNCDNLKTVTNLKPFSEYDLNMHLSDQGHQQNPSFHGFSAYASTTGTLRDLSLSLSAQESSQNALFSPSGFLAGAGTTSSHLQRSVYLKAAQHILSELCSKITAETAAGSLLKSTVVCRNVDGGSVGAIVSTIARSDQSFISAEGSPAATTSAFHALQHVRSSHDQQVPAGMAHMQLHDHSPHQLQHDHLQPSLMDRSQILDLKRRKLLIMLEELEKRFKKYQEQMQVLVMALDTSGVGLMLEGAAPYKEAAAQTMQKRFTCLRDAIFASDSFIMGGFSGDGAALGGHALQQAVPGAGECDQAGTSAAARFRLLDQQLRNQRALQHVGLFPQPPWRPQRGLPERSVSLLRAWLFDHFLHPYPKDTEKVLLARQTGLTRNQVSNWFINARVRLWKPMVEEMYQEEMKTAEMRRTGGQGNPIKPTSTSHSARSTTGTSDTHHFHVDQSKKNTQSDFANHVMAMQDLGPLNAMQSIETSRFFYKPNEYFTSDSQSRQFHHHQDDQVSFAASIEVPTGKATMETVLEAAQQCGTHTWPFIQHQSVPYDAQEQQQHYCNSDISTALMRFGSTGGVTLTLGLQQHSGAGGSINCAGQPPFERSPTGVDDVNAAAHRWCE